MNIGDPKSEPARVQPVNFRIFLASPCDVHDEREVARKVISLALGSGRKRRLKPVKDRE